MTTKIMKLKLIKAIDLEEYLCEYKNIFDKNVLIFEQELLYTGDLFYLEYLILKTYYSDKTININGNVDISWNQIVRLSFQFGHVDGNFDCSTNYLTSLNGCPKSIKGNFKCTDNKIRTLKYLPKEIGGELDLFNNKIKSLKGC